MATVRFPKSFTEDLSRYLSRKHTLTVKKVLSSNMGNREKSIIKDYSGMERDGLELVIQSKTGETFNIALADGKLGEISG